MDEISADLRRGLKMCHSVLDDFRLKLAANSNEADAGNGSGPGEIIHG
jgi:hypothetical protein